MNPDPHDNFVKCRFVWSNDKKTDFIQKLDSDLLSGLENELDKMLDEKVFDKVTINDINGILCELVTKSASECNMGRELNSMNKNINKKKAKIGLISLVKVIEMNLMQPKINSGTVSPSTILMFFVILVELTRDQSEMR